MKIGCLQFAPAKGDVNNNLSRADAVLLKENAEGLDLLVLPELAFSGTFQTCPLQSSSCVPVRAMGSTSTTTHGAWKQQVPLPPILILIR